mgnify:CR=1 FL=1
MQSVRATNVHGEGEVVINGHANGKKEEAHGEGGGHGHEDEVRYLNLDIKSTYFILFVTKFLLETLFLKKFHISS